MWIDGVAHAPPQPHDEVELNLQYNQIELVRFDGSVRVDGESVPLLSPQRYSIGRDASKEVAGSQLAVAYNPTPNLQLVAIPSTVLFQTCAVTSAKAIRRLVFGEINKIVDPEHGFLQGQPDTYKVTLFKDFHDSEAHTLANLVADPVAREQLAGFRRTLITQSANFDRSRGGSYPETHIQFGLPFSNPAKLRVRGKFLPFEVKRNGKKKMLWGFLATEIVDLSVRLIFDNLVIERKNNAKQGENADDPDLPYAFGSTVRSPVTQGDPVQPTTSVRDPAANLDKLILEACGGFTPVGLTLVSNPKEVQKYQGRPLVRPEDGADFGGRGTTGEPQGNSSGLAEVDIDAQPTPSLPVKLDEFLKALEILAERGIRFATLAASVNHRKVGEHVVNYLPRKIRNIRNWHLTSNEPHAAPRGYVVAELHRGGVWHYLIDLERKESKATGSLALAYIRHHTGERIEPPKLGGFMVDVVKESGWVGAIEFYRQWVYTQIQHKPSKGVEAFANAIAAKF
ncbi:MULTISPECIES: hypothetical protein [Ralstonia]|nr:MULTISPECIES: hypothetical protein [Ralstonia]EPX96169.1 hypothetical protein C404_20130 [Ralstonia sp. AU12-08]